MLLENKSGKHSVTNNLLKYKINVIDTTSSDITDTKCIAKLLWYLKYFFWMSKRMVVNVTLLYNYCFSLLSCRTCDVFSSSGIFGSLKTLVP